MRVDRPLLLFLAALTAGCADPEPFVEIGSAGSATISKPVDPILTSGSMTLCYSDATPWSEVEALAEERCAAHGLHAAPGTVLRWQCRATSPHRATFACYDPEMVTESGAPVNPFNPQAVRAWERETGKVAKPHNFMTPAAPAAPVVPKSRGSAVDPATGAPAATQPPPPTVMAPLSSRTPAPTLGPADIAGRPPIPPLPPRSTTAPVPAPGAAYPADNFTLPQGSWGDAFQE